MTIHEVFQKQLDENIVITAEQLDQLTIKCYRNGDPIIPGDQVVFGVFRSTVTDEVGNESIYVTVNAIAVSHIDLYELYPGRPNSPSDIIPWVIEKQQTTDK